MCHIKAVEDCVWFWYCLNNFFDMINYLTTIDFDGKIYVQDAFIAHERI